MVFMPESFVFRCVSMFDVLFLVCTYMFGNFVEIFFYFVNMVSRMVFCSRHKLY